MLDDYLARWRLTPDGAADHPTSRLLPVRQDGVPAMLKVATEPEERRGADTMIWWDGDGAARVLAHEGDALLMERAKGQRRWRRWPGAAVMTRRHSIMCQVAAGFMPRGCARSRHRSCR